MSKAQSSKQILADLFYTSLNAVNGRRVVELQLQAMPIKGKVAIVAIGKAAAAMFSGAKNQLAGQIQSALIITKAGHADKSPGGPCIESGHPVPDEKSIAAGTQLLEFIRHIPKETKFLALISGGASALAEVLPENLDLATLQKINTWLLGSGLAIHDINHVRQAVSLIKGGKALNSLLQNKMTQFLISDVRNDEPAIIGSGLFVDAENSQPLPDLPDWLQKYIQKPQMIKPASVESHIVANNEMACLAIVDGAKQANYPATYHGQTLYGDVFELADLLAKELINAQAGLHIWGGETTLVLPDNPGRGGRNQSLALALACKLDGINGITALVGATDGSDGPTEDAGAIIDGFTLQRGQNLGNAKDYLAVADAGTFLAEAGDLISTGATGTNVMDLVIAIKEPI